MSNIKRYPFAAIVGQENAKLALLLALINPKAGGLLISGEKGTAKSTLVHSAASLVNPQEIVTVPLNVTEDMLFGSIDVEYALQKGAKRFSSGLLGRATNNILYIDEVNLLRQELLVALLDANANGKNMVERDGISYEEEVHYFVLGTMNPEEGTLPTPVLDRFGLFVSLEGDKDLDNRGKIIRRAIDFEADRESFMAEFATDTASMHERLKAARTLLVHVEISDAMIALAAELSTQGFCAGHRAEIYLLETAKAIAAWNKRSYVLPQDINQAALFVLPHRMRKPPEEQQPQERKEQEDNNDDNNESDDNDFEQNEQDKEEPAPLPPPHQDNGEEEDEPEKDKDENSEEDDSQDNEQEPQQDSNKPAQKDKVESIDTAFTMPKMHVDLGKDRIKRRGSGKRSVTKTDLKQGRYVRSELPKNKVEDLAFDATIRAAAPFQRLRESNGFALNIHKEDLRQKVREKRVGSTFLFAVDASGSMGANQRMKAVKGAVFHMLQEAYQKRDRVGMIAFRRDEAEVVLPITRSVDLAQKSLAQLPTGGKTPLAEGLESALTVLARLNKQDAGLEPILVLVTDGRANAGEDAINRAVKMAQLIGKAKITSVVLDTENDFIKLGIANKVAQAMGANYYKLNQLTHEAVLRIVRTLEN